MSRIILTATIFALTVCVSPGYCQGTGGASDPYAHIKAPAVTPEQLQLNQQLTAPQEPLRIIQQHQGVSNSSLTKLIDDMKGMVKDIVRIDVPNSGDPHVRVKAPFVNVDLEHGQPDVKVNAPFVHVTKSGGKPVSVKAPFTKIGDSDPANPLSSVPAPPDTSRIHITAPFVNVDNTNGSNVNVHAPFTNVDTGPGRGTQVQAPFTTIGSDAGAPATSPQTQGLPAGTNTP